MASSKTVTIGCLTTLAITVSLQVWSAERLFPPIQQPLGSIAPIVLSNADLSGGSAKGYRPWFENGSWQGDLVEYTVTASGGLSTSVDLTKNPPTNSGPNWSARLKFAANEKANSKYWDTIRKIITWNGSAQVPFRFTNVGGIGAANQKLLDPVAPVDGPSDILNFVRGDRSKEFNSLAQENPLRRRNSILGDIIHSKPVYVGAPNDTRKETSYAEFAQLNSGRAPRVYVGANDGMLHVFDAADGNEVYAYAPSMLMGKLSVLAARSYPHAYYVDGEMTVRDAQIKDKWHTILAGSLGAGGKGFFILDITDPNLESEDSNDNEDKKVLFEFSTSSAKNEGDLGDSFSRPVIAKLNDGDWYVVIGNGYNSVNGEAVLYLVNLDTYDVTKIFTGLGTPDDPNGLSSPSLLDTNRDGIADYAYAGDIDGNLWKFDLTGSSNWKVAYNGSPLHPTAGNQAIVQAPQIALHPQKGYMLYFATGRLLTAADLSDTSVQSLYGIWDSGDTPPSAVDQKLLEQTWDGPKTYTYDAKGNAATQTIAIYNPDADNPDWKTQHGWKVDFPSGGYRVLQPVQVRANRVKATVHKPIRNEQGENWLVEAVLADGGPNPLTAPIYDLNVDAVLNLEDRYQDASTEWHVPMMWRRDFGVMSQVTIAYLSSGIDALFVNNLQPRHDESCKRLNLNSNCPSGLLGGHIDLQTYHRDVPLDGKPTADTHEYDSLTKRIWVDFFDLFLPVSDKELCNIQKQRSVLDQVEIDSDGNNDICPAYPKKPSDILKDDEFIVLVANADLSPGSTLRIGNKTWNVMEYQWEIHNALKNWDPSVSGSVPKDKEGNSLVFSWGEIEKAQGTLFPTISHEFDDRAILYGVLHPTQPACVATNTGEQLTKGRWRNGALTTQLIKKSYFTNTPVNPAIAMVNVQQPTDLEPYVITQEGERVDTSIDYPDDLYETVGGLVAKTQDERIWESTLFWHFGDLAFAAGLGRPCYGDPNWEKARDFELSNDPISATLAALKEDLTSDTLATAVAELERQGCSERKTTCDEKDYVRWETLNNLLELSKDYTRFQKTNAGGYLPPEITFIIPGGTTATITEGTSYEPGRMSWTDIVK